MSAFVDPKSVLPIIPTRESRARPSFAQSDQSQSASVKAPFVDILPRDLKDRIGRPNRDPAQDRAGFERQNEQNVEADQQKTQSRKFTGNVDLASASQRAYSAPVSTSSDALLTAQQLFNEGGFDFARPLSEYDFANTNSAYVNAGAQKGGFAAATAAAIAREQSERNINIVQPVITDVDVVV